MRQRKKSRLSESTVEELTKQKKSLQIITGIFAIALVVLFILVINLYFKNGFSALTIVPIALTPILIVLSTTISEINKEVISRKR